MKRRFMSKIFKYAMGEKRLVIQRRCRQGLPLFCIRDYVLVPNNPSAALEEIEKKKKTTTYFVQCP
jgi:hypothetical protein